MKKAWMLLIISVLFCPSVHAAGPDMRARVIGAAFKGFADTYLAACDFDKEKRRLIDRLEKTSDEDFAIRYNAYWPLIEELPVRLKVENGISQTMTRKELIARLEEVQRQDLRQIVGGIPDEVVTQEFDKRVRRMGQKIRESDLAQQIQMLWESLLKKVERLGIKKS